MKDIKTRINDAIKDAMKSVPVDTLTRDTLRWLKGEVERDINKEVSDAAFSKHAKKLIATIKETNTDKGDVAVLQAYVLEEMTEEEISKEIADFILNSPEKPNMGQLMTHFKINFGGMYDGKLLSSMVKEAIA